MVELRERELDRRTVERSAATFRRICDTYSALFIVNDDPHFARSCGADGVHVGQDDMPVGEARELLGPDAVIGLSSHTEEQIQRSECADYISVGPIWETPTKEGRPATGVGLIGYAAREAPVPFYAIGGIDVKNPPRVVGAGARRLCVVRAIRDAPDPGAAAAALRRAFAVTGEGVAPGG